MNYLKVLKNATFLVFGLLLIYICGLIVFDRGFCDRVQDMIVSEPQDAMDAAPIQVSESLSSAELQPLSRQLSWRFLVL